VIRYLLWSYTVPGWTSVIVSIYFVGGLLFANLGILGLYIGKVFDETKGRLLYVVRERTWSESITSTADVRPVDPDALSQDTHKYRSR
jgi:dolichol-phosphate mannosyltransferase